MSTPSPMGVMICTPFRHFPHEATPVEQAKYLDQHAPAIGRTLRELVSREDAQGYRFEFAAAIGGLCRARNNMVSEFLASSNKLLLWWDQDLDATADHVLRLLAHRQPVVGGLYCKRASGRPRYVVNWLPAAEHQRDGDGLLQVAELGTGFKLIHRQVLEELARIFDTGPRAEMRNGIGYRDRDTGEHVIGFYQNLVIDGDLLSEDYFMDYLCRCAGVPIWADTKMRVPHRGADGTVFPDRWPPVPGVAS